MKGQDHVVRYVNANDKETITVVAGIAADGTKLPLQFIAKGETAALDHYRNIHPVLNWHTQSLRVGG